MRWQIHKDTTAHRHSSCQQFLGGKAGIDATRNLPAEGGYARGWPEAT